MIGNNDLLLNEATMIEAVQLLLDAQMVMPAPTVTGISVETDRSARVFRIGLDSTGTVNGREIAK